MLMYPCFRQPSSSAKITHTQFSKRKRILRIETMKILSYDIGVFSALVKTVLLSFFNNINNFEKE